MADKNDPIPLKILNQLDRQAATAQKAGKPVKLSSYMVRCVITELKMLRAKRARWKRAALSKGYRLLEDGITDL